MHYKRVDFFTSQIARDWHARVLLLDLKTKNHEYEPYFSGDETRLKMYFKKLKFCNILEKQDMLLIRQFNRIF